MKRRLGCAPVASPAVGAATFWGAVGAVGVAGGEAQPPMCPPSTPAPNRAATTTKKEAERDESERRDGMSALYHGLLVDPPRPAPPNGRPVEAPPRAPLSAGHLKKDAIPLDFVRAAALPRCD